MSDEEGHSSEFSDDEIEDDDEETMVEEEDLDENGDVNDELRMLNEENELSLEELRRRYYGEATTLVSKITTSSSEPTDQATSSSAVVVEKTTTVVKDYFAEEFGDDEEDDDYVPKATLYWKKDVRIGDQFQVVLPLPIAKSAPAPVSYEPPVKCTALWRPKRTDEEETMVKEFLATVAKKNHDRERELNGNLDDEQPQANRPPKSTAVADDENALYALYKNDYNANETLKQLPFPPANGPRITGPEVWRPMNEDEVDGFEAAFREYGKNFYLIQKNELTDRTVGELVYFYYVWKKTERHDMFVDANRNLGLTDLSEKTVDPMDILADQQLGEGGVPLLGSIATVTAHHTTTQKHWLSVPTNPTPNQTQAPE